MTILVIDGQGGKLGRSLVEAIKKAFPNIEIMAVGTNSTAANSMHRGVRIVWQRGKTLSKLRVRLRISLSGRLVSLWRMP